MPRHKAGARNDIRIFFVDGRLSNTRALTDSVVTRKLEQKPERNLEKKQSYRGSRCSREWLNLLSAKPGLFSVTPIGGP